MFFVQMISTSIYPIPEGLDMSNAEQLKSYISTLPTGAFALVILSHVLGAFMAGFVAAMVSRSDRMKYGWIAGGVILLFTIWNAIEIPHPTLVMILDLVLTTIAAYMGARLGASRVVA